MSPPRIQSGVFGVDTLRSPGLWIRVSEVLRPAGGGLGGLPEAPRRSPPGRCLPPPNAVRPNRLPAPHSTPLQAVLATLVWALVADNAAYSRYRYAVFVGVTTSVLCGVCVTSELRHWATWVHRRAVLAMDCIYWILW